MTDNPYVPGVGPRGAQILILGESPSFHEVAQGMPFVGPSGKELDRLLRDAGINRGDCWITNTCKYFVPPSDKESEKKIPFPIRAARVGIDMQVQLQELQNEINSIKPNVIIALGSTALWALSGKTKITNYRGSILSGMGCKFVPTYHPAHLLHSTDSEIKGYWNRQVMIFDLKRAKEESYFPEKVLPSRHLHVCKNSAQLYDFIERHKNRARPAIDIEALHCIPSCIGIAFTPQEGISVPLWNGHGISSMSDSDILSCWMMIAKLLWKYEIVGQNFKYDQDKLKRLGFIIRKLASDTMLKAFTINPELPKRLAFNTSIYTREPYYKDEGADFDISKQSIDDLFIYNARDACVTKEIDLAMDDDLDSMELRPFYENFIMELHPLYLHIEEQGFRVDPAKRDMLIEKYVRWDEQLRYKIFKKAGIEVNSASPKQVAELLFNTFKLPPRKGTGEEELTALLNLQNGIKNPDHREVIEMILENRRVRKSIGTYMMALPDYDGKMKTTYFMCLETGRTGTGQQDPPIRPTIEVKDEEGKKKKKVMGMAFQTITKHGDIGQDIREQFIPDDGYIFIQADSSQAEARVVALLSDDDEMLALYDNHDIHALTASWFFGGSESDYSKKVLGYESPIRFAGKTLRHAGHLGAAKRRASTELNTQARKYKIDIRITEAIAERALQIFHAKSPKIRTEFHNGVIEALKRDKNLLCASVPYGLNIPIGGKRIFFERWGDELFRQAFSYIPQRSVTDNTKAAAIRIRKIIPEIKIILEAHDALVFMVREDEHRDIIPYIRREMERPIDFSQCSLPRHELIIPCDIEVGYDYRNFKKFKDTPKLEFVTVKECVRPRTITEEFTA